jgi:hypothetical protein
VHHLKYVMHHLKYAVHHLKYVVHHLKNTRTLISRPSSSTSPEHP